MFDSQVNAGDVFKKLFGGADEKAEAEAKRVVEELRSVTQQVNVTLMGLLGQLRSVRCACEDCIHVVKQARAATDSVQFKALTPQARKYFLCALLDAEAAIAKELALKDLGS